MLGFHPQANEIGELDLTKVEALKEKWAATIMMLSEEYSVAREKLLIAQKLHPELDNISLMLTICDILLLASSVRLSHSKVDFNCILDLINPTATYSDAGRYLRDLVASIDSIKGEFPGAELALEIVQKALDAVSDRQKHFDDGFRHDIGGLISYDEVMDTKKKTESFSTLESCRGLPKPDVLPLEQGSMEESSLVEDREFQQQEFHDFGEERNADSFEPGQIWAVHYQCEEAKQRRYARIGFVGGDLLSVTWLKPVPINADERRWCDASFPVACGVFSLDRNSCDQIEGSRAFSYKCSWVNGLMDDRIIQIYPKRGEIWAVYKEGVVVDEWICNPEARVKGRKFELIEMFSDYSKRTGGEFACLEKVNGFCSVFKRLTSGSSRPVLFHISPNNLIFSHKIPAHRILGGKDEVLFELDQMALPKSLIQHIGAGNSNVGKLQSQEDKLLDHRISTDDFATGQVWAIYRGKDKTPPHHYAVVNSVASKKLVSVTLLEPEHLDHENKWRGDLPVACGMFKHGDTSIILNVSQFSHLVKFVLGSTRPHCMIYPKKGEIWAMYKNWSRKWGHADYGNCQFRMVEIISDFSKENGVNVAKLEQVHSCLTFFCRQQHEGFDLSSTVFEADMLSFSHQILAYRVPGIEGYGIPEDSWHLEPRAIPANQ